MTPDDQQKYNNDEVNKAVFAQDEAALDAAAKLEAQAKLLQEDPEEFFTQAHAFTMTNLEKMISSASNNFTKGFTFYFSSLKKVVEMQSAELAYHRLIEHTINSGGATSEFLNKTYGELNELRKAFQGQTQLLATMNQAQSTSNEQK